MKTLRNFFPYSFQPKHDLGALIVNILLHIVLYIIISFALSMISIIPVIRIIARLTKSLVELYCAAGVIISILDYFKILK